MRSAASAETHWIENGRTFLSWPPHVPVVQMILVKLGGSVITDKCRYRTFNEETVRRLAKEIVASGERVVLVHGAGSYGHVVAKKYQLQHGRTSGSQNKGVAQVSWDVRELDTLILNSLVSEGLDAVSIVPGSSCTLKEGKLDDMDVSKFRQFFDLGITPVTFGDVILDSVRGFGICSGDQLMMRLAEEFRPERVIFVTDVDGVFTSDPHDDPDASLIECLDRSSLDRLPRSERCDDVTGSIFAKIEYMLQISRYSSECIILNGNVPGRLQAALQGDATCCSKVEGD